MLTVYLRRDHHQPERVPRESLPSGMGVFPAAPGKSIPPIARLVLIGGYGYGGCGFGGGNVHSGGDAYQYAHAACVAFAVLYISKHVLGNHLMFFVDSLEATTAGNSNIWSVTTKDRVSPQLYLRELSGVEAFGNCESISETLRAVDLELKFGKLHFYFYDYCC